MPRSRTLAIVAGGLVALAITGIAMAHPGGIVDRVDVFARALGISSDEVDQAKEDGTLRDLVGDLTLNELSEAYDAELGDAIDQALSDGLITPEQAERLGDLDLGSRSFGGFGRSGHFDREDFEGRRSASITIRIDISEIYADLLGLTEEEYDAAREDGTLRDLVSDLDSVAVTAAIVEARDAQIDEALAAGDITEEEAGLLRDFTVRGLRGFGGFGPDRERGSFHGGRGFGGRTADSEADSSVSSTGLSI